MGKGAEKDNDDWSFDEIGVFDWQKLQLLRIEEILASSGGIIPRKRGRPSTLNPMNQFQPFRCSQCPSSFSYERGLQQHLKYACYQQPRFQCPYCEYRSKWRYNAYNHVRHSHKDLDVYCIDILADLKYENY